jgi:hypothetical protein
MAFVDVLRQRYPQYEERTDEELVEAYRKKYHPTRTAEDLNLAFERRQKTEAQKLKDETSLLDAFGTGLYRGRRQTGALLLDALPAIAADLVGADEYRDRQLQEYQDTMADIEAKAPSAVRTFRDIEDVGDAGLYAAETIGQFIPSIATSLGGGLVGGFVGRKAAEGFARKLVGDAAEAAVKKGKGIGFVAGTFAGSGSQTIPEAYTSIAEETGEPAAATALFVGSINAALDSILPVGVAKALGKDAREETARALFTRLMIGGGKGAAVEGLTEGVQEANNLLAAQLLKDNPEFFTQENVDRILDAGLRGAIGGKAFGLVSGIPGESPQQRTAREQAETQQQLRDDITTVKTEAEREAAAARQRVEEGGAEIINPYTAFLSGREDDPVTSIPEDGQPLRRGDLALPAPSRDLELDAVSQRIIAVREDPSLTDDQKREQLGPLIQRRNNIVGREPVGQERRQGYEITALEPQFEPQAKPANLSDQEILQWAEQNQGQDAGLSAILDADITTQEKANQIQRRLQFKREEQRQVSLTAPVAADPAAPPPPEPTPDPTPPPPAASEFTVKTQKARLPDGSIDEMRGPVTIISDGTNTQYIARVSDQNNKFAWYKTDEKGDPPQGSSGIPPQPFADNKKEAVAEIKAEMAGGDPVLLQQLVDDGTLTEEQALERIDPAQASAAVGAPQTAKQAPAVPEAQITPEQLQAAQSRIQERVEALRTSGDQGSILANAVNQAVTQRGISVEQAVTIFDTADVLNEVLPQRSRDRIRFVQQLMDRGGAAEASGGVEGQQVAGLNTSRTQDAMNGMIELSLGMAPETVKSTAAHEAFHTLQDYFAAYDKGSEKILNSFFGTPRQQVEYDRSGAAKFIKRLNPTIDGQLRGKTLNAGEIAAHTFQAFDQARREGKTVPGTGGPVRRFLNFLSQFFPRMKSLVMGRGFRSVQDVMRDASTGRTAQRFAEQERPVVGAAPQASTLLTTDTSTRGDAAYGLLPFLRFKHDKKFNHKRKINQGVNPANAERQIDSLDELLDSHPNTLASEEAFADYLADAMGKDNKDGSVPMLPFRAIQMANNPDMIAEQIGSLTNGQRNMAEDGFQSAEKFRLAYEGGLAQPEHTGKLILWGILSRGVSPFVQESLFLDVVQERGNKAGIGKFIKDAGEGNFNLDAYLKWVKTVIPDDSPGAGATHNLNAFGEMTLTKMSQRGSDGLTMLQKFHNLVSDQSLTGRQVRREFHKMNTGIGINNKVVSFMLLVSGRNDVMVLDRVQFRNLFNDGRLGSYNLYDGQSMKGPSGKSQTVSGTSIQGLGDGTMGLMMYEALERDMMPAVREAYRKIGRGPDASMGRFHWESWVASSAQEVDHGTIDGIIHDAMGIDQPYNSITTKEGRYTQYKGGSVYGYKNDGQPYLHIPDGLGNMYEFTPSQATNAFQRIAKGLKRDGIMPTKIKISENKDRPYYERRDINNEALGRVLKEEGGRLVQPRVRGAGQGNTDGTRPDAQGTTQASAVLEVRAAAAPQAIGQTGGMIDVLANQDTEGALLKAREGFTKYFKSGRWLDDGVDRFHPLSQLDRLANDGVIGLATKSAMKIAQLAVNMSGRSEFALLHGNLTYDPKTGELGVDENSEGLLEIFKSIGAGERYTQFQQYAIARRALTLKDDTRRRVAVLQQQIAATSDKKVQNQLKDKVVKLQERQQRLDDFLTDERIADGMQYDSAEFRDVFDRYNDFNQKTLKFLVDTGVISEKQKDAMNIDYIPYYKFMEQEEFGSAKKMVQNSLLGPRVTQVFDNPDAGIQELTGREGRISDLYENIIKNNNAMISAGLKNVTMQRTLDSMKELGFAREVTEREKNGAAVVSFNRDGVKTYFDLAGEDGTVTDFNQRVFMALSSFSPPQLTGLMDIVQKVTSVFRNAITLAPNFMLANLIRGDIAGFVTVTEGQKPIFGTLKGFKNVMANDRVSEEMKGISGVGGYAYGQDTRDFANVFKRKIDPQTNIVAQLRKAVDGLQEIGEASELSTRDGIYRATLERTGSKTEAAYQALNLVNFNRRGNPQTRAGQVLSLLIPMVPFLNARIQGLYRTGTALTGREADQAKAIKRMAMLAGISGAIWMMSSQDDRWDDEPLYRKMNYHILYAGDYRILIPKAFEVGALAQTLPEVILDIAAGQEGGKYAADAAAHTFFNTFSFNPIPQIIKPTLEVYTNYDFFRSREIESARLRNLPKEQRADTTTPGAVRALGQVTSAVDISPVQLETLVRGHLGTLGVTFLNTIDTVLSGAGLMPAKPDGVMPGGDILGINRFIREGADPSNKWVGEVYDLRREANEIYNGIRALREDGQREAAMELMKENRSLLSVRKSVGKLAQSISKITKQINKVRNSETLSSSEKKDRLNTLINRRNQIAERVERLLDRAGK